MAGRAESRPEGVCLNPPGCVQGQTEQTGRESWPIARPRRLFPAESNSPSGSASAALLKAPGAETSHCPPRGAGAVTAGVLSAHWLWEDRRQGFRKEIQKDGPEPNSETMFHPKTGIVNKNGR